MTKKTKLLYSFSLVLILGVSMIFIGLSGAADDLNIVIPNNLFQMSLFTFGTPTFSNGFESGWVGWSGDRAYYTGSASYALVSSPVASGSQAGSFTVNAQTAWAESRVHYYPTALPQMYATAKINPSSLSGFTASGAYIAVITIEDSVLGQAVAQARIRNSGGSLYWALTSRSGGMFVTQMSSVPVSTGSFSSVSLAVDTSAGASELMVNGASVASLSGLNLGSYSPNRVKVGISDKPSSSTIPGAESIAATVVVDDCTIGTVGSSPTPTPSPTPYVTPTPSPTSAPTSTPSPTPIPTVTPTPAPTAIDPNATPTSTPAPTSNPTSNPTSTPTYTAPSVFPVNTIITLMGFAFSAIGGLGVISNMTARAKR